MSKIPLKAFVVGLFGLGAFCCAAGANTLIVGTSTASCPNAQYNTIAAAITASGPGDEIDICPGTYPEQLVITQPLTLRGIAANSIGRVLLQPALSQIAGLSSEAVITVLNTRASIQNLAIDASNNTVTGCAIAVSGVHFIASTGSVENNAIFGAQLQNPKSCPALFPGNGFGVQVDGNDSCPFCRLAPVAIAIDHNSIHDFGRDGVLVMGSGVNVDVSGNTISGVGPSGGYLQFGIFLANGASGRVTGNVIHQRDCGALSTTDCFNLRSEGVVLRSAGDGTVIDGNTIAHAQFGLFLNGANAAKVTNNLISDISAGSGMQLQSITNSVIEGNTISEVGPINQGLTAIKEGCGIKEISGVFQGASNSGNHFRNNTINDAYCGVGHVEASTVESGTYFNTLYTTLDLDQLTSPPPPTEP